MSDAEYEVRVDADLADLIPAFLERRRQEVHILGASLEAGDMEALRRAGHTMRGTCGGYGFEVLSRLGDTIEAAANAGDRDTLRACIQRYGEYMARVEVVYEG